MFCKLYFDLISWTINIINEYIMPTDNKILIFENANNLDTYLIDQINKEFNWKKKINFICSGGTSLSKTLSKFNRINGELNIFLSDERVVNIKSDLSNKKMIKNSVKKFKHKVKIITPPYNLEKLSKKKLINKMEEKLNRVSQFDFAILSVGEDGHFASIFNQKSISVSDNFLLCKKNKEPFNRISLSFDFFLKIKKIYFILNKKEKFKIFRKILSIKTQKKSNIPIIKILKKREKEFNDIILVTKNLMYK